ncbi:SUMF1/EgtB/PvdO family nonheme iron enzyme [Nannocystis sp. RBIL2]|uniref:formylglycine-generating enzyme family protein n=1 Tax=Nannocystis sp. RBIL2 TaxID=2996788 RepID=UPI0022703F03|nr:SUMF1/EgtB/PvdO family nonheme iron enzyme [Nannocystis sp. RBIL2]MCY1064352.1 SUMF1/EgtB/PvdO family nonheme iron enzyme [Nannocystis sp. RBIL2]
MPRLSSLAYTLLIPTLTVACQTTVNLTEGTATNTQVSTGDTSPDDSGTLDPQTTGDCAPGDEGCPCYGNGTCNDGLVCNGQVLCEPLPGNTTGDSTSTTGTTGTTGTTTGTTGTTTDVTTGDTSSTTSDTTGSTSDDTTGGVDPGCGDVPDDMVCIPADSFEMGTSLNIFQDFEVSPFEKPAHMVTLTQTYWMDQNEVTVEDYAVCWALQVCELPMQGQGYNWGVANKEKHPINGVNWYQAKAYCEWKGKRLPTEAEWELAARGTDGRMYPWGDAKPTCEHVVSDSCSTSGTQVVGSRPLGASPYGLLDMGGNVIEWCADYFKDDYYYQSPAVDPKGPADGTKRSARSFMPPLYDINIAALGRATYRAGYSPLLQDVNPAVMGIRCAQTAP